MSGGISRIKKEFSLKESQGILYGDIQGYMITASRAERRVEIFVDARFDTAGAQAVEAVRALVTEQSASCSLSSYRMDATGISVTAREKDAGRLIDFVYKLLDKLVELKVDGLGVCSNCGRPIEAGCGVAMRIDSHAHYCDRDCADRLLEANAELARHTVKARGSFAGFAGALTGCIAAMALYFVAGVNGWFCAAVGVLFPVFAGLGYDMLGGNRSVDKVITVVIAPLVSLVLIAFVTLCAGVYRSWHAAGYVFTLNEVLTETVGYITKGGAGGAFLTNQLGIALIFAAAGWLIAIPDALPKKQPARTGELGR